MRFNIRIDRVWRWLLLPGGATEQNSYVMLGDDGMHFRFGLLFNRTVPYDNVAGVFARSWPFHYGIGWRSNLRSVIGLTGSYRDVVEVRLKERIGNWIAVSLEDLENFIRANRADGADSRQQSADSEEGACAKGPGPEANDSAAASAAAVGANVVRPTLRH
jgi:hypothetical protein